MALQAAVELGRVYALLSVLNGPNQEHFEEAQALLKCVDNLGSWPREEDQRKEAPTRLAIRYLAWNRPEDAAAAYEEAPETDPSLEEAKRGIEEIRHH
jgi:hypothetical protein